MTLFARHLYTEGFKKLSSSAARSVYMCLMAFENEGKAWPSIRTMSKLCRLHHKTVTRVISEIEQVGLMSVEKRSGRVSNYYLKQPCLESTPVHNGDTPKNSEPCLINTPTVSYNYTTPVHIGDTEEQEKNIKKQRKNIPPNGGLDKPINNKDLSPMIDDRTRSAIMAVVNGG